MAYIFIFIPIIMKNSIKFLIMIYLNDQERKSQLCRGKYVLLYYCLCWNAVSWDSQASTAKSTTNSSFSHKNVLSTKSPLHRSIVLTGYTNPTNNTLFLLFSEKWKDLSFS